MSEFVPDTGCTIHEPTGEKYNGQTVHRIECHCGNMFICPATRVRQGNKKSCGCMVRGKGHVPPGPKAKVQKKNKTPSLTLLDAIKLWHGGLSA